MKKLQIPLEEGKYYHVFNRGNNGDNLFYKAENYKFFLRKLDEYLSSQIEVFAFCLLPNHFHLLVGVREREAIGKALHLEDTKLLDPTSKAFHRFFTSFSKAINKQEKRHGSLIENPFKRKEVTNVQYLANLVFYIHANPQLHGICDDFRQYPWSSYDRIISGKPSKLKKDAVLAWFNNVDNYIAYHTQQPDLEIIRDLIIE
jgi:REP element-mobilizing transposase RayT